MAAYRSLRVLQLLPLELQLPDDRLKPWQHPSKLLQVLDHILQFLKLPVDIIGPVDVLGLPSPVAIHYALVYAPVLRLDLLEIASAPGDADEGRDLFVRSAGRRGEDLSDVF
jgi:hypothetical protein